MSTLFELLGGTLPLRAIVTDFVTRVVDDLMIGYFFRDVDREALIEREFEFARAHLGGGGDYRGRPLPQAHAPHGIRAGHFARRIKILEETLDEHAVPASVRAAWLAHDRSLERSVVDGDCNTPDTKATRPLRKLNTVERPRSPSATPSSPSLPLAADDSA